MYMSPLRGRLQESFLVLSCAISIALTCSLIVFVRISSPLQGTITKSPGKDLSEYSYDVDDFPYSIPINPAEPVKMVVEESAHYTLNAFPRGDAEWHYLIPRGGGTFRLGPQNRAFSVSMFHQLHCLRYFRNDYLNYTEEVNLNHVQHCFNYLRQTSLCHADLTLEPGDFTTRHFQHDRVGATHICGNWKAAYEEIELNWAMWKKDREAIGIVAGTEE